MAFHEFTREQNTAPVEAAHVTMTPAQVDNVEFRAKAEVVTAKSESGRASEAESKIAGGNSEGKLYGDIATKALGVDALSIVTDFLDDSKSSDPAKRLGGMAPASAVDADDFFFGGNKKPGVYRAPVSTATYGSTDVDSKLPSFLSKSSGQAGLIERSNIVESSLKDQDKDQLDSWKGKDTQIAFVQEAKKMTFGKELASENALASVQKVRAEHSAHMGHAQQLAPGMGLGSGPSISPAQLLSEAREDYMDQTSASGA